MASPEGFVFRPSGNGEAVSWRAEMVIKAAGVETGGSFSLIETTNPPDSGPPLHLHHTVDEAFYVLEGTYEFECGDERTAAGPGSFVLLPHRVPHRYRAGPAGGRVLVLFLPGRPWEDFTPIAGAITYP